MDTIKQELQRKYENAYHGGSNDFDDFKTFYRWAVTNGYYSGATLKRYDANKPFSPKNCYFPQPSDQMPFCGEARTDFIRRWNRAVNPFRRAVGLRPFPDPEEE